MYNKTVADELPIVGGIATGDDFYGRTSEIDALWRSLRADHVLLLAPRRVGKTSIMVRLQETAEARGYKPIFKSVAGCADELSFVRELYRAAIAFDGSIWERLRLKAKDLAHLLPKQLEAGPVSLTFADGAADRWTDLGEALVRTLHDHEGARHLLLVDELPIFVLRLRDSTTPERVRRFLDWFRDVRQRLSNVRWLLAGSVGLDSVTHTLRLTSTINDLHPVYLGAYSIAEAEGFLEHASKRAGFSLDVEVRAYIIERVGWPIPFFLAYFVVQLDRQRAGGELLDRMAVDRAFDALTSFEHKSIYSHWDERLETQLAPDKASRARSLLGIIAADAAGVAHDSLLAKDVDPAGVAASRSLLWLLQAEGYVVSGEDGRWRFRSPLLRAYWNRFVEGKL